MTRKEETAMLKTLRANAAEMTLEIERLRSYNLKLLIESYEVWRHNCMLKVCLDTATTFKKANDA